MVAAYALSQQWFSKLLKKRRETIKKRKREGKRKIKREDKHQSQSQEPYKAISALFKTPLSSPSLDNGIVSD